MQTECGGCGELIWDLLLELGACITREMAEAVYPEVYDEASAAA